MEILNNTENHPYFKVRYFIIWNKDTNEEVVIDGLLRDYIYSQKYQLQLNTDYHYCNWILDYGNESYRTLINLDY